MSSRKFTLAVMLILALSLGVAGCSHIPFVGDSQEAETPAVYNHFDDVLVPGDMKMDRSDSFVYETAGFKAGTIFYSGYVDADSVVNFFTESMPKDGWKLKSTFRYPRAILLFEKEAKSCIVVVYEKMVMTHLEIWVAPTL